MMSSASNLDSSEKIEKIIPLVNCHKTKLRDTKIFASFQELGNGPGHSLPSSSGLKCPLHYSAKPQQMPLRQ